MAVSSLQPAVGRERAARPRSSLFGLGIGWNLSFVPPPPRSPTARSAAERGKLLGFNDLLAGPDRRRRWRCSGGVALSAIGVAALAIGGAALVVLPAAWILMRRPLAPALP